MSVNLSPLAGAGAQFFTDSGAPLTGGLLYTYAAGTTTPTATYTTSAGSIANSNPIVLDAGGRVPYEIWLTAGVVYKFVLKSSVGTTIGTWDNLRGVNDPDGQNFYADTFTTTAGQTAFTLTTSPGTVNALTVSLDGAVLVAGATADFTWTGTTLTLTMPAYAGQSLRVAYSGSLSTSSVPDGSVVNASVAVGANIDSDKLGYLSTATGAVSRTVEAKLGDTVSVKDFGAVGDGVTDDTAAIQAALNASASKMLIFPAGNVFLCGSLTATAGMTLKIDGTLKMKNTTGVLLSVSAATAFQICGAGTLDLNNTQYIGVLFSSCVKPVVRGVSITNMLGGAASTGDSGAIAFLNCTAPFVSELIVSNILHGTAPSDSHPRAITFDACTDVVAQNGVFSAVNTAFVIASCTDAAVFSAQIFGGGVVNDNAFYCIGSNRVVIQNCTITKWDGEPIVFSSCTNCMVLDGAQINCTGNANGFENCTNITYKGIMFYGDNLGGLFRSRIGNVASQAVRFQDIYAVISSTDEIMGFFSGATNDVGVSNCTFEITYDTGKTFGSKFLRLQNTNYFAVDNNTFILKELAAAPAADNTFELTCSSYSSFKQNRLINRTVSGKFRVNGLGANVAADDLYKQNNIDAGRNANYALSTAEPKNLFGTAIPAAGTFNVGDRIWSTAPAAGGAPGWICTTAGTPGTWKAMANLAP